MHFYVFSSASPYLRIQLGICMHIVFASVCSQSALVDIALCAWKGRCEGLLAEYIASLADNHFLAPFARQWPFAFAYIH